MKRRDFAIGLSTAVAAAPLIARATPSARRDWPTGPLHGDRASVEAAWTGATSGALPVLGRGDALVIIQNGKLVFERYGADHAPTTRHISWSMAKSITHAVVGAAVLQGKVDIEAPLKLVPHGDPKLNLRSLLTLTDGMTWDEADYDPAKSDAARMLYGPGRFDGAGYTAALGQSFPPGTHWRYSTGAFQLAAAEVQAHLFPTLQTPDARRAAMADWLRARLFGPLGMTTALPEFDAAGTFAGGSWVYASARDFARFGELYRLDGVWKGRRLLPEGWVKFARTATLEPTYGAGFWLEAPAGAKSPSLLAGAGPLDAFAAEGHDGQIILIVPSKALVLVRLGFMSDGAPAWKALGEWLTPLVKAFPDA